jgi:hypothetical protein
MKLRHFAACEQQGLQAGKVIDFSRKIRKTTQG